MTQEKVTPTRSKVTHLVIEEAGNADLSGFWKRILAVWLVCSGAVLSVLVGPGTEAGLMVYQGDD